MQSLSGHYLMRQKVPVVLLLLLVYLGTVVYISVEISLGSFWRRDILPVKGQALFTNCNLLWLCVICNHWVATSLCTIKYPRCIYFFGLSKCCCLHFCRNKLGLLLVQGIFKGSKIKDLSQIATFYDCVRYAIIKWWLLDAPSSTHGVFTSFNLSKCCYLNFWRKKFRSMLAQGYFKGQRSSINQKL